MKAFFDTGIESTDALARAVYVLAVACLPIAVAGTLTLIVFGSGAVQRDDGIGHQTSYAYFDFPKPGDLVADQFDVSGQITTIPSGEIVYLVERVDNHFWPKLRIGTEPTTFNRTHYASSGKGYKYTIELLSVSAAVEKQISRWFDRANKTGKYPGIDTIDDAHVLAKVRVVQR